MNWDWYSSICSLSIQMKTIYIYKESTISILNPTDEDIKQAKSLVLKDPINSSFNPDYYDVDYNEFIDVRLYY